MDRRQDISTPVVISEENLTAYLLGEADREGIEILDDVDVVNVVTAHLAYFEAIGAVGPLAAPDDVIDSWVEPSYLQRSEGLDVKRTPADAGGQPDEVAAPPRSFVVRT